MEKNILPIADYPGYYISNYGEVYSKWQGSGGGASIGHVLKRMKLIKADGRLCVGLSKKGKRKVKRIHRLVLEAFVGKCPDGMEACHFPDRNTSNNRLDNLRWDTKKSNMNDKIYHGTTNRCERNGSVKLKKTEVIKIRTERNNGVKYKDIANKYNVSISCIQQICENKTWKYMED